MSAYFFAITIVTLGGVALAIQTPINAALARGAGDGIFAAAASFLVGFLTLLAVLVLRGRFPQLETLRQIQPWLWMGGMLGAFYVWAALSSVQRLGALTLIAALIGGQMIAALAIDASGMLGIGQRDISWQRLMAVFLVAGGIVLSRY
jgi:transporter family-2 protein